MAEPTFAKFGYNNAGQFQEVKTRAQDVLTTTGVSAETHITNAGIHLTTDQIAAINGAIQSALLGAANGVATLDANMKLTLSQLPSSVTGGLNYQDTFNPNTGEDAEGVGIPEPAADNKGFFWIASVAGEFTPPGADAAIDFAIGDWLVSNGDHYAEVDNTTVDDVARAAAATAQTAAENAQTTGNNAQTAAEAAQSAAEDAQEAAEDAATAAALLDAAYCTDEEDMAGKNLRNGAFVLMAVTNTSVDEPGE
ncbi:MAG: hypothetical protein LBN00_06210 [Oscillospiraceae bacterium]|jgi:hypothetical protein|nr:hypothetical protein [Oscillospiraceae bacterium]